MIITDNKENCSFEYKGYFENEEEARKIITTYSEDNDGATNLENNTYTIWKKTLTK